MAKYDSAGLAMIPSGYKASKVYSLIPNSSSGDFDFARSSSATRVNKDGLIETVATNVPRLDYPLIDGVVQESPALLLEPLRRNLLTYSEELDNAVWTKVNVSITPNSIVSPSGQQNADKVIEDSANTNKHIRAVNTSLVSGISYSVSFFLKQDNCDVIAIREGQSSGDAITYKFSTGRTSLQGSRFSSLKEERFPNGWIRISTIFTATSTASHNFRLVLLGNNYDQSINTSAGTYTYTGDGISGVYAWGVQVEDSGAGVSASYATSYIPTSGSTVTRSAETCTGAGTSADFNDSEGVLFAEIANIDENQTTNSVTLSISDGTLNNSVTLYYFTTGGVYYDIFNSSGTRFGNVAMTKAEQATSNKIALKYKSTDIALWINGFEADTNNGTLTLSGLNEVAFDYGSGSLPFYGKSKQLITFKQALTDAELEDLTSWDSFSEMATAQLYKLN